jgi:Right handed beta helix region
MWAVVTLIAGSVAAEAATYYVDQTTGSDGSSGKSPGAPWKNCPGTSAYAGPGTLCAGDIVYFKRDETWLVSGPQGIYLSGGVTYVGNSWGTGNGKARIRANSNLDAGIVRFRDHGTYETVFRGFDVDGNGKVTTGVDINHRYCSLMNGATKRVQDCEVHHTWSEQASSQYKYGIIVSNTGGTGGYAENVEIIDCIVHDTSRDAICLYPGDQSESCRIKNMIVRGCEVYNTGQDPDYGAGAGILVKGYVQDAVIEYNYVHDTKGARMFVNGNENRHYGVGPTNIHIRYNIFNGNTRHGSIRVYDGRSGKDPKDLKIYGNLIYNNTVGGGFYIGSDLGNTLSLLMYNNTFYNAPVIISNNGATVTLFEFKNNIVDCGDGVPLTDAGGQITSHSNNIFHRGSGVLVRSDGFDYSSGDLASGYEPTASSGSPIFKNTSKLPTGFAGACGVDMAPNSDGLSLQEGSPGINKGIALGSGFGGSINSVRRPTDASWDIGAYQSNPPRGRAQAGATDSRIVH